MPENRAQASIFIVEDEAVISADLSMRLKDMGYSVLGVAVTAETALDRIALSPPDLVLMDIELGGPMDGISAADIIHEKWGIPVIFLTAHAEARDLEKAKRTSPLAYLLKPVRDKELRATLEIALYVAGVDKDRKKARNALMLSEEKFRLLTESSPIGVYLTDEKGNCIFVNQAWRDMAGLSPEQALGSGWVAGIHPDDRERVVHSWRQMVESKGGWGLEYRFRTADGKTTWVHGQATELVGGDGRRIGYLGANTDITERKRQEEAQRFLAECGWIAQGEDFFQALARYLAQSLDMDFICVDRLEEDGLTATTVAVYSDGRFEDNLSYALKDTPCGAVVDRSICCFPTAVRRLFPKDEVLQEMDAESYAGTILWGSNGRPIGLIAVISRKPLSNPGFVESVLKMAAVRAAGELERQDAEARLARSDRELRIRNDINQIFLTYPDEAMYAQILKYTLKVMHSEYGTFGYFNEEGSFVSPAMTREIY
jgi:PAS domain S-box-containing protein